MFLLYIKVLMYLSYFAALFAALELEMTVTVRSFEEY